MPIRSPRDIAPSEITPLEVFERRRDFLRTASGTALGIALQPLSTAFAAEKLSVGVKSPLSTQETQTAYKDVTSYNNFYEFGTDKSDPAQHAHTLKTRPWTVSVEGLVKQPKTFAIDDLIKLAPLEERIYRMRCVEGWSMVIPWLGLPLATLLKQVEPLGSAKYVEFISAADPKTMQGCSRLLGCYVEGLVDEAQHPRPCWPWALRRGAAQPERRAGAHRRSLEVRFQGREIHRGHPLCRAAARQLVAEIDAARVRFLFERESHGGSPALEPGDRAPRRRVFQTQNADVQRLRRSGGAALRRHGLAQVLLTPDCRRNLTPVLPRSAFVASLAVPDAARVRRIKAALFAACLYPLASLIWLGFTGGLGADPVEFIRRATGTWTLDFLIITLSVTPLRRATGWHWLIRLRRMFGLYAFFYAAIHVVTYLWLDQLFDLAAIWRDVMKRPLIAAGFLSFVLMTPLAATSTDRMVRRLGGRWRLRGTWWRWPVVHFGGW